MKKNTLKTKINELSKYLKSESSKDAISVLLRELVDYSEPVIDEGNSNKFILPKEVSSKSNAYALYTDGACRGNPGPGSYAFMVQNYTGDVINEGSGVENMTTNNKMEMKAIVEGLSYLSSEVSPMHEIFVFTDSKYVVD
jgi:ribonuclease HI